MKPADAMFDELTVTDAEPPNFRFQPTAARFANCGG